MTPRFQFLSGGLNVVLDGQWGSTGKGKLCGFLGGMYRDKIRYCCSSFGPNAGHTYVDRNGNATVTRFLPSSAITSRKPVLIMADSVLDLPAFLKEVEDTGLEVYVHPRTAVLGPDDEKNAKATGRHLAGTMKGTGHAIARKILRMEGTKLAKDYLPPSMIRDTCEMARVAASIGEMVVLEMSQGFDLSINHGHDFPYLTSRDITIGAALNSAGCPPAYLGKVIGSIRTFPIRVGNVDGGWSGPHYADHEELTWNEVTSIAKSSTPYIEQTTVTKRVRRVFGFSIQQVRKFVAYNNLDYLFLNFAQYLNARNTGVSSLSDLTSEVCDMVGTIKKETGCTVALVGTGPRDDQMVPMVM